MSGLRKTPILDWLLGERGWVVVHDGGKGPQHENVYAIHEDQAIDADWVIEGPTRRKAALALAEEYRSFSLHMDRRIGRTTGDPS